MFFDESHFNLSDTNRNYGRSLVGKKAVNKHNVRANGSKTLLVTIDFQRNHYNALADHSKTTATDSNSLLKHMGQLIPKLPNGKILVMDNCRIHKTIEALMYFEFVKENFNIEVKFLPPYSPDYNPIELLFNVIKAKLKQDNNIKKLKLDQFGIKLLEIANSVKPDQIRGFYENAKKYWETIEDES